MRSTYAARAARETRREATSATRGKPITCHFSSQTVTSCSARGQRRERSYCARFCPSSAFTVARAEALRTTPSPAKGESVNESKMADDDGPVTLMSSDAEKFEVPQEVALCVLISHNIPRAPRGPRSPRLSSWSANRSARPAFPSAREGHGSREIHLSTFNRLEPDPRRPC